MTPPPPNLKTRLDGARRVAVLAIGSELRADDYAGILVGQDLEKLAESRPELGQRLGVFLGHTAPENMTGVIKRFAPSHLVIIDAADAGRPPGEIFLVEPEESGGATFFTHRLPTQMMIEYLLTTVQLQTVIIGIQPRTTEFGKPVSPEVRQAVEALSAAMREIVTQLS